MIQKEMIKNWFGHEMTEREYEACEAAHKWSVDWDLPIPDGIEKAYEKKTGKSCVYWGDGNCSNPSEETLPRTEGFQTCGYTEGFYSWLEEKIANIVRKDGILEKEVIWKKIVEEEGK